MDQDAAAPGLEAIEIPELRQLAPGGQEGVLQRVLCQADVAQDPEGHREQPVADLVHQESEGVTVPFTCPLDEVSIHLDLCGHRAWIGADYSL